MKTTDTVENDLKQSIAAYLRHRSGVSLIEMCRDIDGFAGEKTWVIPGANLTVWSGMSDQAIAAMMSMIVDEEVAPTVSNLLVYAFDGGYLDLPVAKSLKSYKTKRWIPLVFAGGAT